MEETLYKKLRNSQKISREKAAEKIGMSVDKLEKIENGRQNPSDVDIVDMIDFYKAPELRYYYCKEHCAIGQTYVRNIPKSELATIAVNLFNSINDSYDLEGVLLRISDDGKITEDELDALAILMRDFSRLKDVLDAFELYIEDKMAKGEINEKLFKEAQERLFIGSDY